MITRDLLRLPLGSYNVTNGIYNYTLRKSLSSDQTPIYFLTEKQGWGHVTFFEDVEEVRDGYVKYEYTYLSALAGIAGFRVHSTNFHLPLWDLKFVPKTTFKQWLNNHALTMAVKSPQRGTSEDL